MTPTADGVPWSLKLISHARAEIEDARALRDAEVFAAALLHELLPPLTFVQTIARLLITGRDALIKIQEKMAAKQAVSKAKCRDPLPRSLPRPQSLVAAADAARNKGACASAFLFLYSSRHCF